MSRDQKVVPPPLPEEVRDALPEEAQEYIESLEEQIVRLRAENKKAKQEIENLNGQLLMRSHNSSKPPSSDGLSKKPVIPGSQRTPSSKKPGGQPGHSGSTLLPVSRPDRTELHRVTRCGCGSDLSQETVERIEVGQTFDLPTTPMEVTEHRREVKICPCCRSKVTASLPAGLKGVAAEYGPRIKSYALFLMHQHLVPVRRVSEILREMFGVEISIGSLMRWTKELFHGLTAFERDLKIALIGSKTVHFDETGMRVQGSLHWVHNASTAQLTFFGIHAERGPGAMQDFGILPHFRGIAVHDHWKSYFTFEECLHSLCNAHILRELKFLEEAFGERWSRKMRKLLLEIHERVAEAKTQGKGLLSRFIKRKFLRSYGKVLHSGFRFHAAHDPVFARGARGRVKQTKGKNLLDRLRDFQTEVLRFMNDFQAPFTNNQAEQDIRMNKVKQKISGCFRSFEGAVFFCRIRSYLSTMRKQGKSGLDALRAVLIGKPIFIAHPR